MILELAAAIALGPPVFLDRAAAQAGEVITVHARTRRPVRLYLAPTGASVRSRFDDRLRYFGTIRRASGEFEVPAVNTGRYRVWCTPCVGRGPTLVVNLPATCPATSGANDALRTWTDTVAAVPNRAGGYSWKWYWQTASSRIDGALYLSASRLDAPRYRASFGPVRTGVTSSTPSWASVVSFPTAGCWRITARLPDVSLIRVVEIR